MDGKEVKLLFVPSPFVFRLVLVLELKKISYEIIPDDVANKSPLLLQSNPVYKKFPVLIHKSKPICESWNIIQYLDEAFPHTLAILPWDPFARARERFWADFVDNKICDSVFQIFYRGAGPEELAKNCALLEEELSRNLCTPYFAGEKLGLVDVVLLAPAIWMLDQIPSAHECPNLHKLMAALRDHPVVKSALPSVDEIRALMPQVMPLLKKLYGVKP